MKKGILLMLLAAGFTAKAQKLKDLLYSGKLKLDSTAVIRNTDDLKSKTDTSQKKVAAMENVKMATPADSAVQQNPQAGAAATAVAVNDSAAVSQAGIKTANTENAAPAKSPNKIWKEYTDSLMTSVKAEVLTSKKIKKETYYMLVEYEIGTDGQVSILNVTATPENALLQGQVKERMLSNPPQMNPVMDSANKPRKVKRKYSFTITKD